MQMTGFENAPAVMFAYVDLPLFFISARHGAGVGFTNDQIGLFKHQKFFCNMLTISLCGEAN